MTGHASNCDVFAPVSVLETEWPCSCGLVECGACDDSHRTYRNGQWVECDECQEDE